MHARLAHRPLPGGPLARPLGAGGGADARLRRQELVADPRDRRPALLPQTSIWESRSDFERYWFSEEIEQARAAIIDLHDLPILPAWHTLVAAE